MLNQKRIGVSVLLGFFCAFFFWPLESGASYITSPTSQWTNSGSSIFYGNNVGVGTTDPHSKLDVVGNVSFSNNGTTTDPTKNLIQIGNGTVPSIDAAALNIKSVSSLDNNRLVHVWNIIDDTNVGRGAATAGRFVNEFNTVTPQSVNSKALEVHTHVANVNGTFPRFSGDWLDGSLTGLQISAAFGTLGSYAPYVQQYVAQRGFINLNAGSIDDLTAWGFLINRPTNGGTINNTFKALYLSAQAADWNAAFGPNASVYGVYIEPKRAMNYFAGSVGIGTTNPGSGTVSAQLEVSSPVTTESHIRITNEGTNWVANDLYNSGSRFASFGGKGDYGMFFTTYNSLPLYFKPNDATAMTLLSGGNVGIGTTAPAKQLEVAGAVKFSGIATGITPPSTTIDALTTVEYVNGLVNSSTSTVGNKWTKGGDVVGSVKNLGTTDNYSLPFITNNSERMRITNGGNIGIGVTAPTAKVDIRGADGQTSGDPNLSNAPLALNVQGGTGGWLGGSQPMKGGGISLTAGQGQYNSGDDYYGPGGDINLRAGNGNIAGQVSITGGNAVDINDGHDGGAVVISGGDNTQNDGNGGNIYLSGGTGIDYGNVILGHNGTQAIGNVGIGTINPVSKLEIGPNPTGWGSNDLVVSNSYGGVAINNNSGNSYVYGSQRLDLLALGKGVSILTSGNVGIGVTNPAVKLDVSGPVKTSRLGHYGTYNSSEVQGIWSISEAFPINTASNNFGTQYGIGYAYSTNGGAPFSGTHQIVFTNNGTIGASIGLDGKAYFAGNFGIGITSPEAKLHLSGFTGAWPATSGSTQAGLAQRIQANGTNDVLDIGSKGGGSGSWLQATSRIDLSQVFSLVLNPNGGSVGIGTTAPGSYKLNVNGTSYFANTLNLAPSKHIIFGNSGPGGAAGGFDWTMTNDSASMYVSEVAPDQTDYVFKLADNTTNDRFVWWIGDYRGPSYDKYPLIMAGDYAMFFGGQIYMDSNTGRTGIGIADPSWMLEVGGEAHFDDYAYGVTAPEGSDPTTLATIEYVDGKMSSGYLPISGGTGLSGNLDMNYHDIQNVNKLSVNTIDPLYNINGKKYSTYAPSISGGVKEEYIGKISLDKKINSSEYGAIIDFSAIETGSDLWVWRQVIDFNKNSVEVLVTPYGRPALVYYIIEGDRLSFHSDRPTEISYRLIGKRFDWRSWPTFAADQSQSGLLVR